MVNCRGNERTNNARTVSIDVISFGNRALFVSDRYCKNTNPVKKKFDFFFSF